MHLKFWAFALLIASSSCNNLPTRDPDCKCPPECLEIKKHCGCKETCVCRTYPNPGT